MLFGPPYRLWPACTPKGHPACPACLSCALSGPYVLRGYFRGVPPAPVCLSPSFGDWGFTGYPQVDGTNYRRFDRTHPDQILPAMKTVAMTEKLPPSVWSML